MLDRATVREAKKMGAVNIGMSLDGTEETHDFIRKKGSFARIMTALDVMKEEGMHSGIVTCIHKKNIHELKAMRDILVQKGVANWQLQAANPMGNLLDYPEWLLEPGDVDQIIDIAHDIMTEGGIRVDLADSIGYYNLKEVAIRKASFKNPKALGGIWRGCPAGKTLVGIRCNGDIIGCLSIRDDFYIEANIRDLPLEEIWTRPGAFSWNRDLTKAKLSGFCHTCQFGSKCLGGCSGTKLIRYQSIGENHFCSYRYAVEKEKETIATMNDFNQLVSMGRHMVEQEDYQLAEMYISKALQINPDDIELLNVLGFIHFNLENFVQCEQVNQKVLALDPENVYALKGLGICASHLGRLEEGISLLQESIARTSAGFLDPYFDLAVILANVGRKAEGLKVLEEGRARSDAFKDVSEELYQALRKD